MAYIVQCTCEMSAIAFQFHEHAHPEAGHCIKKISFLTIAIPVKHRSLYYVGVSFYKLSTYLMNNVKEIIHFLAWFSLSRSPYIIQTIMTPCTQVVNIGDVISLLFIIIMAMSSGKIDENCLKNLSLLLLCYFYLFICLFIYFFLMGLKVHFVFHCLISHSYISRSFLGTVHIKVLFPDFLWRVC